MSESSINKIAEKYRGILQILGEDIERAGLSDTPERIAKSLAFLTSGYKQNLNEVVNGAIFPTKSDGMIVVRNIEVYSLCEHHLLPFIGTCNIGYLPRGKVLGISKFARIVEMFSRRLQIQENMTQEIAEAIQTITCSMDVCVVIKAKHLCMMMRGVQKQNSEMLTSEMLGKFRDNPATRKEFFEHLLN